LRYLPCPLYRAREAGFSARLIGGWGRGGGTWYWNRYPEARFDSESYTYAYLFSKDLFEEWEWQEHFSAQPEIERYLNYVVDRFDLRDQHKVRRQGHLGRVRRVVGDVDGPGRRRHRRLGHASSSPPRASCPCRTSLRCPGAKPSEVNRTTRGYGRDPG
jgi:hypothetical protein